ncbi:MAG: hypothetical protein NTZ61_01030 [Proteobacteria bacterium]|nr:hypothetical protein [Pseudomonadota bacterium]
MEAIGHFDQRHQRIWDAERLHAGRGYEDGEAVSLEAPEAFIVGQYFEVGFDRLDFALASTGRGKLLRGFLCQILQRDAIAGNLARDRRRREIDRDGSRRARERQILQIGLSRNVDVEHCHVLFALPRAGA